MPQWQLREFCRYPQQKSELFSPYEIPWDFRWGNGLLLRNFLQSFVQNQLTPRFSVSRTLEFSRWATLSQNSVLVASRSDFLPGDPRDAYTFASPHLIFEIFASRR